MKQVNLAADADATILRVSGDAKATVKLGAFSRLGQSRVPVKASDHDFKPEDVVTPYGIFLPKYDDLTLYMCRSKVTADFIVDCYDEWWSQAKVRFPDVTTLLFNLDNGPENHSRRTQFMYRMIEFSRKHEINVRLAYYPPYHSKYNPVERCWGVLEQHWNGDILDELNTVVRCAQTMTYNGKSPLVQIVDKIYATGVRLSKALMAEVESQLARFDTLGRWFIDIVWKRLLIS